LHDYTRLLHKRKKENTIIGIVATGLADNFN